MIEETLSHEEQPSLNDTQTIFDNKLPSHMNPFQQACENPEVELAIGIMVIKGKEEPIIYHKGHMYNVATLLAHVLRDLKRALNSELET